MASNERDEGRSAGDLIRMVPALLILAALLAFAFANTQRTNVDLVFTDARAPLFVILLATAVVGAMMAALFKFERRHHH